MNVVVGRVAVLFCIEMKEVEKHGNAGMHGGNAAM